MSKHSTRAFLRHLSCIENQTTVYHHVLKALRISQRLRVGRDIAHGCRIEDDEIREHSLASPLRTSLYLTPIGQ